VPTNRIVTEAEYDRWKKELSNWGRWGKDDQIGALSLITPAKRRQAAALVKDGFFSLAGDADTVKAVDNPNPYEHTMLGIGSDRIAVGYHGIAHTHLDSLAHINAACSTTPVHRSIRSPRFERCGPVGGGTRCRDILG